ncbi:MAG: DUF5615 family PIN-like protein [Candidatus Binatia bacterium]
MKVLLDTCVWGGARGPILDAGHDVVWAGDWNADPGDDEILAIAHHERRVLVTLDKDFGELAIVRGERHSGIVRLVDIAARSQGQVAVGILRDHGDELARGAIVTAEPGRLRVRPAE